MVLDRPTPRLAGEDQINAALREHLARMTVKDAAREVARQFSLPRRDVYQAALAIAGQDKR